MSITRVGVVGCGLMGAGIAEVCARAGLDFVVAESSPAASSSGQDRVHTSLERAEAKGRIDSAEAAVARASNVVSEVPARNPSRRRGHVIPSSRTLFGQL